MPGLCRCGPCHGNQRTLYLCQELCHGRKYRIGKANELVSSGRQHKHQVEGLIAIHDNPAKDAVILRPFLPIRLGDLDLELLNCHSHISVCAIDCKCRVKVGPGVFPFNNVHVCQSSLVQHLDICPGLVWEFSQDLVAIENYIVPRLFLDEAQGGIAPALDLESCFGVGKIQMRSCTVPRRLGGSPVKIPSCPHPSS